MGPAYLVSVGYMDPGNWATDLAGGSQFGYTLIWVLLMSNIMALLLQSLSARLGIVQQLDLAQASRAHYPPLSILSLDAGRGCYCRNRPCRGIGDGDWSAIVVWSSADVGCAEPPCWIHFVLLLQNYGVRKMEAFIITLVAIIGVAFVIEIYLAKPDIGEMAAGFIPSIPNSAALYIAIGIIGATVMPHNLYLHSALVQTRRFGKDEKAYAMPSNSILSTLPWP